MRVLIVAPTTGFASSIEIDSIAPSFETDIIAESVTLLRLLNRVKQKQYDILHFITHGTKEGLHLSNDEIAAREDIARMAKHTKARMVFLNACDSRAIGQYLVDVGIPSVVAHDREIADDDAVQIAGYFYNELAVNGGDLKAAYSVANPRDGTFSWLSNGNYRDPLLQELKELRQEVNKRNRALRWLSVAVVAHMSAAAVLWLYFFFF